MWAIYLILQGNVNIEMGLNTVITIPFNLVFQLARPLIVNLSKHSD